MVGDSSLRTTQDPLTAGSGYGDFIAGTGLSVHTKRAYARQVAKFCAWLEQTEHPKALTDVHARDYAVRDWKRHLLGVERLAPKTVQQALTSVDSFYRWLGLGSPDVTQVRVTRPDPKALDEAETRLVLRAAERRSARDLAIVATALLAGPRLAEIEGLDVEDVEIHARSGWLHIRLGKGDQPRSVPLGPDARTILGKWIAARRHWPGADTNPALFLSREGRRMADATLDYVFDEVGLAVRGELAERTNEPSDFALSAHVLRHTFATDQLRAGVDPATVAEWLGHRDLKTLLVYTRPTKAAQAAAIERQRYDF